MSAAERKNFRVFDGGMSEPPANEAGKLPPHNEDTERALVATAILKSKETMPGFASFLRADHFFTGKGRRIYEACLALHSEGKPIDYETIGIWLGERKRLDEVGRTAGIVEFCEVPTLENPNEYARAVVDMARIRRCIQLHRLKMAEGYGDVGTAQAWIDGSIAELATIGRENAPEDRESNYEALQRLWKDDSRRASGARTSFQGGTGLLTGLGGYDASTGGLHGSQLTVIAARPGFGKTAFALQVATDIARRGTAVAFFSLEMKRDELLYRQLARSERIEPMALKKNMLTADEWSRYTRFVGDRKRDPWPVWFDDRHNVDIMQIKQRVSSLFEKARVSKSTGHPTPLGLIVIDYVQRLDGTESMRKRWGEDKYKIAAINAKQVKLLAQEFKIPVLALAQLKPDVDAIADSSEIAKEADNVCFILGKKGADVLKFDMVKHRGGPVFDMNVRFEREFSNFTDQI